MDIHLDASAGRLDLHLGPCQASLTPEQALTLRNRLAEILLQALHQPRSHWEVSQNRIRCLGWLADTLLWIKPDELASLLQQYDPQHQEPLLRYARHDKPELATRLLQTLPAASARSLEEETSLGGAIPIQQVVLALEALHPLLAALLGTALPPLPDSNLDLDATERAYQGLHKLLGVLPSLPENRTQPVLNQLKTQERTQLLWLVHQENWSELESWLLKQLPGNAERLIEQRRQCPPQPVWIRLALARRIENLLDLRQPTLEPATSASPALNDKARLFLKGVGELPASLLQMLLKRLSREHLVQLLAAARKLQVPGLEQRLETILPGRLFQQLLLQNPASLEATELRSLMTQLGQELKRLKSLQQGGTQAP